MDGILRELKQAGLDAKANWPMKNLTTFKIGGRAKYFVEVRNATQAATAVKIFNRRKQRYMAAGWLSNVLLPDNRVNMAFIKPAGSLVRIVKKSAAMIHAGAGASDAALTRFAAANGMGGLEFMAGIPGTVGGAVYMNAGAFAKGIGAYVKKVYAVDQRGNAVEIKNNGKMFSYRHSIFQGKNYIILGADIRCVKRPAARIKKEVKGIIAARKSKHPLEFGSAGSFFKNGRDFTAGKVIEEAGLKGLTVGRAQVSKKHANFIVNLGGAKAADVKRLAKRVKAAVWRKCKIRLEEEVRYIK